MELGLPRKDDYGLITLLYLSRNSGSSSATISLFHKSTIKNSFDKSESFMSSLCYIAILYSLIHCGHSSVFIYELDNTCTVMHEMTFPDTVSTQ